jgi:hypothetical protein
LIIFTKEKIDYVVIHLGAKVALGNIKMLALRAIGVEGIISKKHTI